MKADDIKSIWLFPEGGQEPDLEAIVAAPDISATETHLEQFFAAHMSAMDNFTDHMADQLDAMEKELTAKGVKFNATAMLKPSLWERIQMAMDDAVDWVQEKIPPSPDWEGDDEGWSSIALPIAQTYPTNSIHFEYDDIFAETARFRRSIATGVAKGRDVKILEISLPDEALDFIDGSVEWNDNQQMLWDISSVTEIIPPSGGKLGFALSERQEDGGLPIELEFHILTERNYKNLCELIIISGGTIQGGVQHAG